MRAQQQNVVALLVAEQESAKLKSFKGEEKKLQMVSCELSR